MLKRRDRRLLSDQGRRLWFQYRCFFAEELNEMEFVAMLKGDPTLRGTCFWCGSPGMELVRGLWCANCIRGAYIVKP